jgi:hypothetical protein
MKTTIVELMVRKAADNFKIGKASFVCFEKIDIDEQKIQIDKDEDFSANIEVWALISLEYSGIPPNSYRVINRIIQDWVDEHESELKKIINPKLGSFLKDNYQDIDVSDLNADFDDYIWEDQVDYLPEIKEKDHKIEITIELVLDVEDNID